MATLKNARSRRYPADAITDTDYANDLALPANIPALVEPQLYNLKQAAGGIDPHMNANKIDYMCFSCVLIPSHWPNE